MAELAGYPVVIERGCAMNEGSESADVDRPIAAEAASPSGGSTGDSTGDWEPFGGGYGSPPVTVAELEAAARRAATGRAATARAAIGQATTRRR